MSRSGVGRNRRQRFVAVGQRCLAMLESSGAKSIGGLAARAGVDNGYVSRMVNFTTLTPEIVAGIPDDTVPGDVTRFESAVVPPALRGEQPGRLRSPEHQTRSSTTAIPCPTPMHIVHSAQRPPLRCSWLTAVVASRSPLAPSGWPSAIAPPLGFTRGSSSASPRSRSTGKFDGHSAYYALASSLFFMRRSDDVAAVTPARYAELRARLPAVVATI